jgi:hypothetical protein
MIQMLGLRKTLSAHTTWYMYRRHFLWVILNLRWAFFWVLYASMLYARVHAHAHTHTHTHTCMHIYICVCVCVRARARIFFFSTCRLQRQFQFKECSWLFWWFNQDILASESVTKICRFCSLYNVVLFSCHWASVMRAGWICIVWSGWCVSILCLYYMTPCLQ